MNIKNNVKLFIELTKFPISLFSALSSVVGFMIARSSDFYLLFPLIGGFFLLAGAGCGLNQVQERDIDGMMRRTVTRPIPSGRISPAVALTIALLLTISGVLLLLAISPVVALLGVLALFLYNGIYTPLKRKTAFAFIPGSLLGAIPPLAGFIAGGGVKINFEILLVSVFFLLWQVPHFYLLLLQHSDEYRSAGLPTILESFGESRVKKITFLWISALSVLALHISLLQSWRIIFFPLTLVYLVYLLFQSSSLLKGTLVYPKLFRELNIFVLAISMMITVRGFILLH